MKKNKIISTKIVKYEDGFTIRHDTFKGGGSITLFSKPIETTTEQELFIKFMNELDE